MAAANVNQQQVDYELAVRGLADCIYYSWTVVQHKDQVCHARQAPQAVQERCRYIAEAIIADPRLLEDFAAVAAFVDRLRGEPSGRVVATGLRGLGEPKNAIGFIGPMGSVA